MELIIKKTSLSTDAWYQGFLVFYGPQETQYTPIDRAYFDYSDCVKAMEQFVENLSRNNMQITHDGIYKYINTAKRK